MSSIISTSSAFETDALQSTVENLRKDIGDQLARTNMTIRNTILLTQSFNTCSEFTEEDES